MEASSNLNRQEFIRLFGVGAAALLANACLGGCAHRSDPMPVPGATGVDFTLDLTAAANAPLEDPRTGFVYSTDRTIIIAKTMANTYVAVQAPCPHAGTAVYFSRSQDLFACPNHGAIFQADGTLVAGSGPSPTGLKKFAVAQNGTTLRITG